MQQLKSSRKQTKALWKLEKHKVVEKLPKSNISIVPVIEKSGFQKIYLICKCM